MLPSPEAQPTLHPKIRNEIATRVPQAKSPLPCCTDFLFIYMGNRKNG
jgi:hypothetical protein